MANPGLPAGYQESAWGYFDEVTRQSLVLDFQQQTGAEPYGTIDYSDSAEPLFEDPSGNIITLAGEVVTPEDGGGVKITLTEPNYIPLPPEKPNRQSPGLTWAWALFLAVLAIGVIRKA